MDLGLDGKVILVTAVPTVLAAHCVVAWSKRARVALCARDGDRLREAARACAPWRDVLDVVADVTEPSGPRAVRDRRHGGASAHRRPRQQRGA